MPLQKVPATIASSLYPLIAPLAATTSRAIDLAWTQAVHGLSPVDPFFPKGWGNLQAVNWETDEKYFRAQPPDLQIKWQKIGEGEIRGVAYEKLQGRFVTPHVDRMMAALPAESHTATVQLLQPKNAGTDTSLVVHLAGTGDHGFDRRLRIGFPLLSQNVATLALESPYYGTRRPAGQQGSRLHYVTDLLALGRTTIMEGLCLLDWAHQQGYRRLERAADTVPVPPLMDGGRPLARILPLALGVTGLSMGGVHAAMIAGLCKHPVAVSPHLAPRSAAVAFCEGALNRATAFGPLAETEITCDYIRSVAGSLPHKPNLNKIPKVLDPVGVERLATVLETYTDVTRYPRPLRTDAAVIVAATDDAYVSRESPIQVQRYWPGSEVRWVTGGHVLSFVIHGRSFRRAIMDSLQRLEKSSLCHSDVECAFAEQ